jgi:hypothetical protein
LPETGNDPIGVGYLFAAKPENVGGAGKLLVKRSPILLGESGILNGDAADDRRRKAQGNGVHSHVRSFFLGLGWPACSVSQVRLQNKWGKGKVRAGQKVVKLGERGGR